jgi:hypothetical protein
MQKKLKLLSMKIVHPIEFAFEPEEQELYRQMGGDFLFHQ